jgi:hypothetical protein
MAVSKTVKEIDKLLESCSSNDPRKNPIPKFLLTNLKEKELLEIPLKRWHETVTGHWD